MENSVENDTSHLYQEEEKRDEPGMDIKRFKEKIWSIVQDKPLQYGLIGFSALGSATILGMSFEETLHGISFMRSLQDLHHYMMPLVIGTIGGVTGFHMGKKKEELAQAYLALEESEKRYKELSITDGLTGLFNYRYFYQRLQEELKRQARYQHPLSLLILDVDYFKKFNDQHGHTEGDKVLQEVGKIMSTNMRSMDVAARYGGEEFVLLLPETNLQHALQQAERIRSTLKEKKFKPQYGISVEVTVSIGAAEYVQGEEMISFIQRADKNLYQAKENGRDQQYPPPQP